MHTVLLNLRNEAATHRLGRALGHHLLPGDVLLLQGDLGSGKTTLVQGMGQALGITEPILSPTFTLINEYPEGRVPLYHLDLYRLQPEEVEALQVADYWAGTEVPLGIVAIEWAERLSHLPTDYLQVHLSIAPAGGRQAQLLTVGSFPLERLQAIGQAVSEK